MCASCCTEKRDCSVLPWSPSAMPGECLPWTTVASLLALQMQPSLVAAAAGDRRASELAAILKKATLNNNNLHAAQGIKNCSKSKQWRPLHKSVFSWKKGTGNGQSGVEDTQLLSLENVDPNDLTLLQLLALNALELTAPASDILLKNRSCDWFQLSGHEGAFAPAGPGTIWKKRSDEDTEVKAYEALMRDQMAEMVPKYYRDVQYNGEHFIEMQDLLQDFRDPAIMDIKMGTRTFLESEVQNTKARADLYEKMIKVDVNAPTPEEREAGTITKLRYMQFRENLSASSTLGFRIEGYRAEGKSPTKDLKLVRYKDEVVETMLPFLGTHRNMCKQLIDRLKHLRMQFEHSQFFRTHEVIGSSLLIIYDGKHAGVWMIDFAKTVPLANGSTLNHRSSWVLGNHEDGYLFGLDNLISVLEECYDVMPNSSPE